MNQQSKKDPNAIYTAAVANNKWLHVLVALTIVGAVGYTVYKDWQLLKSAKESSKAKQELVDTRAPRDSLYNTQFQR